MTATAKKTSLKAIVDKIGIPTLIIAAFWLVLLIVGAFFDLSFVTFLSDTLKRFAMNGVLVLAMVPAIQSGTGPNFALPLGVVLGLLAMVLAMEFGFTGTSYMVVSALMTIVFTGAFGYFYGKLMNAVKGSEMTIATYAGFSMCAAMSLAWLMLPVTHPNLKWMLGDGIRETIQLDAVGADQYLNKILMFKIGGLEVPTGLIITFAIFCVIVWLFFRSKPGIAISAGGINPMFAKASGLNIDRNRVIANMFSTILCGLGIIVYYQSLKYFQLYQGPLMMAFPAVASILIGGASAQRAKVSHVILGTFLFQGLLTTANPVANRVFSGTDLSEIARTIIQNGIILYALTKVKRGGK